VLKRGGLASGTPGVLPVLEPEPLARAGGDRGGPRAPRHLPAPISPPPSGSNAPVRLRRVGAWHFRGFRCPSGPATLQGGCESAWLSLPVPVSLSLLAPHRLAVSPTLLAATLRQGNAKATAVTWGGDTPWPNLPFFIFFSPFLLVDKPLILN